MDSVQDCMKLMLRYLSFPVWVVCVVICGLLSLLAMPFGALSGYLYSKFS